MACCLGIEDDLCAMSVDRRRTGIKVRVEEGAWPHDGRTWYKVLKDLDDNHLAWRGGDLRDCVGCGAEAAVAVVISRVLVRVCDGDRPAQKDKHHAEHADNKLPATRRR